MKKYSPGANITEDYCYVCDMCEQEGKPVIVWKKLPKRKGHFAVCYTCVSKLYFKHVNVLEKKAEFVIVKRKGISEKLRKQILKRDNHECLRCGNKTKLELDHIIPFARGGDTIESNLQTLCKNCNLLKRF